MKSKQLNILLLDLFFFSGCFENVDTTSASSGAASKVEDGPASEITDDQFYGVSAANNKITGIEVTWVAATVDVSSYRIYRVKGAKLELIASVGGQKTLVGSVSPCRSKCRAEYSKSISWYQLLSTLIFL